MALDAELLPSELFYWSPLLPCFIQQPSEKDTEEKKHAGRSLVADNNVTSVRKTRKGLVMEVRRRAGINRGLLKAKVPQTLKKNNNGGLRMYVSMQKALSSVSQHPRNQTIPIILALKVKLSRSEG